MHATYTQPTRTAENRTMTASSSMRLIPRRRMAEVVFTLLAVALLLVLPPVGWSQQKPRLLFNPDSLTVQESSSSPVTYTVKLNTKPVGRVVLLVKSSNEAATASPETLTFTTADANADDYWNKPQTVTVTAVNDDVDNPGDSRRVTITHELTADSVSVVTGEVTVEVVDDDEVAVVVDVDDGVTVNEANQTADTYTVALDTLPAGAVTVAVASSDTKAAKVEPASLTFQAGDWSTAQTVTVTAVDDDVDNPGDRRQVTITNDPSGGDYNGVPTEKVSVSVTDDDTRGIVLSTATVSVDEGKDKTYTVKLNSQPTDDVTVTVQNTKLLIATVNPGTLAFTPDNWKEAQMVTVTGKVMEGYSTVSRDAVIRHVAQGGDYSLDEDDDLVTVSVLDVDTRGLTVSPTMIEVGEDGAESKYTVRLNDKPTGEVTVSPELSSGDTGIESIPDLIFTVTNWREEQTVTIVSSDDDVDQYYNREVTIEHKASGADYNRLPASSLPSVEVTIVDNNERGVIIEPTVLTVDDNGETKTYTVKLTSMPSADVMVEMTSSDPMAATVTPSRTFQRGGWSTAQTVTVTAVDDNVDNPGDSRQVAITHVVSGGDYEGLSAGRVTVIVNDADAANVKVSPDYREIPETGGSFRYTVRLSLDSAPASNVEVRVTNLPSDLVTVSPAVLTFASDNDDWKKTETVTVTVASDVDDPISHLDGGRSVTITNTTSGHGIAVVGVKITDRGDKERGVKITPSTVTIAEVDDISTEKKIENTATYDIVLESQPDDVVTVAVVTDSDVAGVSDEELTFTVVASTADDYWNKPQTVIVTAVDDDVDNVSRRRATITHTPSGGGYDGVEPETLTVTVTDNDTRGIYLDPDPVNVLGGPNSSTLYDVKLDSAPTAPVTVTVTSASEDIATVDKAKLLFTAGDWSVIQQVKVTGVNSGNTTITHTATGGDYRGVQASLKVTVGVTDGLKVTPRSVEVAEGGEGSYSVALNTEPPSTVTVTVASSGTNVATVNPGSLTFGPTNWATPQRVTVTARDDSAVNAVRTATITNTISDGEYASGSSASVQVTVTDDDAGVTFAPAAVTVAEAGGTATYTVKLDGQPTDNVTLTVASSNTSAATVSHGSLTFTPTNWSTPQTVTVTGVDDSSPGGSRPATITHSASGGGYDEVEVPSVSVTVTDDDGMTVAPTAVEVAEAGGTATYRVSLNTQPTGAVTVAVASRDTSIATVNPTSLTFTTSNWASQPVTVTGVDDQVNNGAGRSATITNTPSGAGYGTAQAQRVVVEVEDDDPAPTLEIRGGEATEGRAGTTTLLTFTVTKSGPTDQVVTVAYADAGTAGTGTATAGTDYTAVAALSLTFEPAETSKTITSDGAGRRPVRT